MSKKRMLKKENKKNDFKQEELENRRNIKNNLRQNIITYFNLKIKKELKRK